MGETLQFCCYVEILPDIAGGQLIDLANFTGFTATL
jgi:hypothetical protein